MSLVLLTLVLFLQLTGHDFKWTKAETEAFASLSKESPLGAKASWQTPFTKETNSFSSFLGNAPQSGSLLPRVSHCEDDLVLLDVPKSSSRYGLVLWPLWTSLARTDQSQKDSIKGQSYWQGCQTTHRRWSTRTTFTTSWQCPQETTGDSIGLPYGDRTCWYGDTAFCGFYGECAWRPSSYELYYAFHYGSGNSIGGDDREQPRRSRLGSHQGDCVTAQERQDLGHYGKVPQYSDLEQQAAKTAESFATSDPTEGGHSCTVGLFQKRDGEVCSNQTYRSTSKVGADQERYRSGEIASDFTPTASAGAHIRFWPSRIRSTCRTFSRGSRSSTIGAPHFRSDLNHQPRGRGGRGERQDGNLGGGRRERERKIENTTGNTCIKTQEEEENAKEKRFRATRAFLSRPCLSKRSPTGREHGEFKKKTVRFTEQPELRLFDPAEGGISQAFDFLEFDHSSLVQFSIEASNSVTIKTWWADIAHEPTPRLLSMSQEEANMGLYQEHFRVLWADRLGDTDHFSFRRVFLPGGCDLDDSRHFVVFALPRLRQLHEQRAVLVALHRISEDSGMTTNWRPLLLPQECPCPETLAQLILGHRHAPVHILRGEEDSPLQGPIRLHHGDFLELFLQDDEQVLLQMPMVTEDTKVIVHFEDETSSRQKISIPHNNQQGSFSLDGRELCLLSPQPAHGEKRLHLMARANIHDQIVLLEDPIQSEQQIKNIRFYTTGTALLDHSKWGKFAVFEHGDTLLHCCIHPEDMLTYPNATCWTLCPPSKFHSHSVLMAEDPEVTLETMAAVSQTPPLTSEPPLTIDLQGCFEDEVTLQHLITETGSENGINVIMFALVDLQHRIPRRDGQVHTWTPAALHQMLQEVWSDYMPRHIEAYKVQPQPNQLRRDGFVLVLQIFAENLSPDPRFAISLTEFVLWHGHSRPQHDVDLKLAQFQRHQHSCDGYRLPFHTKKIKLPIWTMRWFYKGITHYYEANYILQWMVTWSPTWLNRGSPRDLLKMFLAYKQIFSKG